jgi:hypothetical protein
MKRATTHFTGSSKAAYRESGMLAIILIISPPGAVEMLAS